VIPKNTAWEEDILLLLALQGIIGAERSG